jgi:ABC-type Mn2+/Zn2+ transport system permease subunit
MLSRLADLWQIEIFRQALFVGVAVASVCSILSVIVVVKRMAFIGEGIAHAGFGGLGTALFLGATAGSVGGSWKADLIVLAFCLLTALAIGALARGRHIEPDSAIGILLVAAMAWGVLMTDLHAALQSTAWYVHWFGPPRPPATLEALLFGSLLSVGPYDVWLAVGVGGLILLLVAAFFKEIVFYAFDETASEVFGVRTGFIHFLILGMVAVTIVLTVRLAGIVLVTALLVIPGTTAGLLSRRLDRVFLYSWLVGMIGVVGGLAVSMLVGKLSTGPCIVAVLCTLFAAAYLFNTQLSSRMPSPSLAARREPG